MPDRRRRNQSSSICLQCSLPWISRIVSLIRRVFFARLDFLCSSEAESDLQSPFPTGKSSCEPAVKQGDRCTVLLCAGGMNLHVEFRAGISAMPGGMRRLLQLSHALYSSGAQEKGPL